MADFLPDVWTDLKTAVNAAWPDLNAIFVVAQMQKRNWYNLIVDNEMGPPWCVVHFPAWQVDDGWGIKNQTYRARICAYYIASDTGSHIKAALETKAAALQDRLLTVAAPLGSYFLLTDAMEIDAGDENEVNISFRESDMPFSCVSLSFTVIAGFALA